MKKVICDICGKEILNKKMIARIEIKFPSLPANEGIFYPDVCINCTQSLKNFIERYAEIMNENLQEME